MQPCATKYFCLKEPLELYEQELTTTDLRCFTLALCFFDNFGILCVLGSVGPKSAGKEEIHTFSFTSSNAL